MTETCQCDVWTFTPVVRNYYIPAPLVALNASNQRRTGNNALDITPLNHDNTHEDNF
jgi:hypothetical protein